jgi:hypothetical protein
MRDFFIQQILTVYYLLPQYRIRQMIIYQPYIDRRFWLYQINCPPLRSLFLLKQTKTVIRKRSKKMS